MDWIEQIAAELRTAEEKKEVLIELTNSQEMTLRALKEHCGLIEREIASKELLLYRIDKQLRDVSQLQCDTKQALKPVQRTIDLYVLCYNNLL